MLGKAQPNGFKRHPHLNEPFPSTRLDDEHPPLRDCWPIIHILSPSARWHFACPYPDKTQKPTLAGFHFEHRAAQGTRTLDLRITNALLYQLS